MLHFKQIAGIVFNTFFFAVMLFVPAGTIRWPRAWIFLGVVLVGTAVTMFVLPEELLNERFKPPVQHGQPLFNQIGIFAFVGSFVAAVLFIPSTCFDCTYWHRRTSSFRSSAWLSSSRDGR